MLILGVPTAYIPHGKPDQILAQLGLDGSGIAAAITKARHRPDEAATTPAEVTG